MRLWRERPQSEDRTVRTRWEAFTKVVISKVIDGELSPMITRYRLVQTPLGGIYFHQHHRPDSDRDGHDHPWKFWTFVLRGGYVEEVWTRPARPATANTNYYRLRSRWSLHAMPLRYAHRIEKLAPDTWTMLLVGPKRQGWGFWVPVRVAPAERGPLVLRPGVVHVPWQEYAGNGNDSDPFGSMG